MAWKNPFKSRDDKADVVITGNASLNYDQSDVISAVNDSSKAAQISFPTPWTSRTMSPVPRVSSDKMWGNEEPGTWGGPWRPRR